ncbi:MAG TPA: hypothetical protein VMP08_12230 [Anaerolineae bacterium]|nr:hypothetical protein [Anaerolineae bacterium]
MNVTNWLKHNAKDITLFVGFIIALVLIYWVGTSTPITAITTAWLWIMIIMAGFVVLVSALITGNPLFGWLINEQNRMSLSRLQMFLWTIMILSAFVTAVFANLHFQHYDSAVSIAIPEELWLAMGISVTSLVGSSLILENKKDKDPKQADLNDMTNRTGVLVNKDKPSLTDLIDGEEVGNSDIIDLTRLQNLFFTLVLVGTYMATLNSMFSTLVTVTPQVQDLAVNFPIKEFPALGSSAVALLLISHGGYLVAKAIDNQPSVKKT